ncbi:MAG: KUP/HAK/KT family potassium transporter, partial [Pseudonocardia sp.]|nr:KUP/HAK/KT family potassium transporter [Pseudonocardia sp.]
MTDAGTTAATAVPEEPPPADRASSGALRDHPAAHSGGLFGLALGALGVVFGDIGTSPLYAVQTVFAIDGGAVKPTVSDVYGVVSLVFWSITIVVSIKYVSFILRADND